MDWGKAAFVVIAVMVALFLLFDAKKTKGLIQKSRPFLAAVLLIALTTVPMVAR